MKIYNKNGVEIILGEEISHGGEGVVYNISDKQVAKIFFDPKSRYDKIKAFINKGISHPHVCIPQSPLYDHQGNFVGYVMNKAFGKILKSTLFQPQIFKKTFPSWSRIELTKLAIGIMETFAYLHSKDILVGDINPFNIMVNSADEFYLIDVDSFQVDGYPCPVGTVEFTAPEIQKQNFSNFLRTKEHEYFAIATLLFEIYIPGKHPYSRSGGASLQENILSHEFAFPLGDQDIEAAPKGQWEAIWYNLPFEIRKFFYDTFKENKRHTPQEWIGPLKQYLSDLYSNLYSREIFPLSSESLTKNKTLNMNRRDITDRDTHLRVIETRLRQVDSPQKIAVLELSTKAVKLLVGNDPSLIKSQPFDFKMFSRMAIKTDTGRGLDAKNIMDMTYFRDRVLPAIKSYKDEAYRRGVDTLYTVASAAYRTANNRDEILECIRDEAGVNVRILKKEEEAVATITAFQFSTKNREALNSHEYVLVIDQGGGSTEVTLFKDKECVRPFSMNLGTEVLRTILFRESNEHTTLRQALADADKLIRDRLDTLYNNVLDDFPINGDIVCVAVGTAITKATGKKKNADQHDKILTIDALRQKVKEIDSRLKERYSYARELYFEARNNEGLDGDVVMRLGLPMFIAIMNKIGIDRLTVSGTGLWYGIYFQKLFNI